ncbi:hypothetical protein [Luteolibacter sp. Populi]|uniref:hypothetical protein n=1 Tax=Luteolibacter sp. Populi TaxID=3230487 RepID=UPI00346799BB
MTRPRALLILILLAAIALFTWRAFRPRTTPEAIDLPSSQTDSQAAFPIPDQPTAAERLLEGYGDPATPPIEDLRKIHRVVTGYFSIVKDSSRNPIGGNADLAAALRGENPNREVFVRAGHPLFAKDGMLADRWGTPIVVHPEEFRRLGLRSAGPDRSPYTADDLILTPAGAQQQAK